MQRRKSEKITSFALLIIMITGCIVEGKSSSMSSTNADVQDIMTELTKDNVLSDTDDKEDDVCSIEKMKTAQTLAGIGGIDIKALQPIESQKLPNKEALTLAEQLNKIAQSKIETSCDAKSKNFLNCLTISRFHNGRLKDVLGVVCDYKLKIEIPKKTTLCEMNRYHGTMNFTLHIPGKNRSWKKELLVYEPVASSMPSKFLGKLPRHPYGRTGSVGLGILPKLGKNIKIMVLIGRRTGKQEELLSVIDGSNQFRAPQFYVNEYKKQPFGEKLEKLLMDMFISAGMDAKSALKKMKALKKDARIIPLTSPFDPADTDTAWLETVIIAVFDKKKSHVGALNFDSKSNSLSLGWKPVDNSLRHLIKTLKNEKNDVSRLERGASSFFLKALRKIFLCLGLVLLNIYRRGMLRNHLIFSNLKKIGIGILLWFPCVLMLRSLL
ncbi:ADP-ribose pyrophosphatase [Trichinella pseudospiralis]